MQVFLSHASLDRELVNRVASAVRGAGVELFLVEDESRAGVDVHQRIQSALRKCDVVVALLTVNGMQSSYVQQEIGFAKSAGKLIVPIVTEDARHGDLAMLSGIEYILIDPTAPGVALENLFARTSALRRKAKDDELIAGMLMIVLGLLLIALSKQ